MYFLIGQKVFRQKNIRSSILRPKSLHQTVNNINTRPQSYSEQINDKCKSQLYAETASDNNLEQNQSEQKEVSLLQKEPETNYKR